MVAAITVTSSEHHGVRNHRFIQQFASANTKEAASLVLCEGNPPGTGGFPSKRASNAESVSISRQQAQSRSNKQIQYLYLASTLKKDTPVKTADDNFAALNNQ